jgi:hypothetical protein
MVLESFLPEDARRIIPPSMSKIGLVIILMLIAGKNYAQQDYFLLIQADNKQSFYVRLGSRSIPSSVEGSLILSQLKDSTYSITVGFPGQIFPEQAYSVNLHHKDQQFLLRNQGEKGWILYNPLTGEMRTPDPKGENGMELQPQGVKKDDAFSRLMAGVVRDTAVMYNTYSMERSPGHSIDSPVTSNGAHPDESAGTNPLAIPPGTHLDTATALNLSAVPSGTAGIKTDSTTTTPDSGAATPKSGVPVSGSALSRNDSSAAITTPPLHRSSIVKLSQRLLFRGLRLVYADRGTGGKVDTIEIIIPPDTLVAARKPVASGSTPAGTAASQPATGTPSGKTAHPADTSRRVAPRTNGPNPDTHVSVPGTTLSETAKVRPDTPQKRPPVKTPLAFVNSDCHDYATDYDVDKLRVKMLESSKDDDRIQAVRKVFRTKCFSTRQIRALSEVFTTDALKFRFFETAYPFASDDHFRELAGTLADPVYNSKFKAMTGQ